MVNCLERSANLFACGLADATATPSSLCSSKIQNGLPFWCRLTRVVSEKRPLNGCSVVVVILGGSVVEQMVADPASPG